MVSGIYRYDVMKTVRRVTDSKISLDTVTLYNDYDEAIAWKMFTDGELDFGESKFMYVFANIDGQDQLLRSYERTK